MGDDDTNSYPLNCIDSTGDGFSGWHAISNPRVCNDFCYWDLPANASYAAWNTANPHKSTVVDTPNGKVYWTCIYDAANDKSVVSDVVEERWIDSWRRYNPNLANEQQRDGGADGINVPFPYLRCQKGAGEQLKTRAGEAVKSPFFWESWIVVASLIYVGELTALLYVCKRRSATSARYDRVGADGDDEGRMSSLQIEGVGGNESETNALSEESEGPQQDEAEGFHLQRTRPVAPRCKYCAPLASILGRPNGTRQWLYILHILLLLAVNLLLAVTISFAALSLMEIHANPLFTEGMERWTPACTDPNLACPAGNVNIDRESSAWPPVEGDRVQNDASQSTTRTEMADASTKASDRAASDQAMQPFSYIVASDAQLYWFNGEFAEMGTKAIPSACSPSDSCGRCTGKHGLETNKRLKRAWENLMMGKMHGLHSSEDLPVPKTLVMNGDLTAYFHPWEKRAYDSIYDDIDGLEYYFPSLGNHDIEHMAGAMYGGDEWPGSPPNCNIEHAIGYFKGGFCGQIPHFDAGRIARYDASSLAYSWDEGRYHFVHTHYYPTYEMASMEYHSSLEWLERDLKMAQDAGLTTVLFVHAAQGLNPAMEKVILGKNVRAIVAGHTHRCLHRRCEGIYPLNEDQVENMDALGITAEKCIPAAYDTCQVLNGENLVYAKYLEANVPFPRKKLHNDERNDKPLCPKPAPFYINETDNTLLCHRVIYSEPDFPFETGGNATETIPIFWSGSSSFETFLRIDLSSDKMVFNAMMVASEEGDVARYADLHSVPNAVYSYHKTSDMEEIVIHL